VSLTTQTTTVITKQQAQEVHNLAMARAGLPYSYGGAFTRNPKISTDCSGLVMQTAAWYRGRSDWPGNRYGSTESFRLNYRIVFELGFKRLPAAGLSALNFTPVMLVGLQHGGGGMYSHTACTLMTMDKPGGPVVISKRGVDWESQGNGVFLYDGARAWNDRLFHDYWYLDTRLDVDSAVPITTTPGGDMAQVPQEQWDMVYRALTTRVPSRSIYRTPGEGAVDVPVGMLLNIDAMQHAELIERLAKQGDRDAVMRVARTAAGQGAARDRQAIAQAQTVLADIERTTPSILEQFLTKEG
jgi:hypothetical protein